VARHGCGLTSSQWVLDPTGDGFYRLVNRTSNKTLDVANCGTGEASTCGSGPGGNVACQRWTFSHTDNGWYRINPVSAASSCLIVAGSSTADGANVEQGAAGRRAEVQ